MMDVTGWSLVASALRAITTWLTGLRKNTMSKEHNVLIRQSNEAAVELNHIARQALELKSKEQVRVVLRTAATQASLTSQPPMNLDDVDRNPILLERFRERMREWDLKQHRLVVEVTRLGGIPFVLDSLMVTPFTRSSDRTVEHGTLAGPLPTELVENNVLEIDFGDYRDLSPRPTHFQIVGATRRGTTFEAWFSLDDRDIIQRLPLPVEQARS